MIFRSWLILVTFAAPLFAGEPLFRDDFNGKLAPGWSFIRENPAAWRVTNGTLQILIEPGNMWGPQNDGKNILVRDVPAAEGRGLEVSVTVSNNPTGQWEQVDLVWYYNDSCMVKIGLELVDGKLSIVMGREENDRARTIALIAIEAHQVQLSHRVRGNEIEGYYRPFGAKEWIRAGQCTLPVHGTPRLALQCYQGLAAAPHWAEIRSFTVQALPP